MHLHEHGVAIGQMQLQWQQRSAFVVREQVIQAHIDAALQQGGAHIARTQAQQA